MARGIGLFGVSASDDPDIAGGGCTTRCLQRGEQRTRASSRTLAISYLVSDIEGCLEGALVTFSVDLDPVFLLSRFGERWYRSLESSQNNTLGHSTTCIKLLFHRLKMQPLHGITVHSN